MNVILLEKIRNLGNIGEKISVKSGFARNYLIPYGKAVMATEENIEKFTSMRAELEKNATEALKLAQARCDKISGAVINVVSKATEEGKLFGSISASNVATALKNMGFEVKKNEISMPKGAIRQIGEYDVVLLLHPDVSANIKVNVVVDKE